MAHSSPPVRMLALVGLLTTYGFAVPCCCWLPQLRHRVVRRSIAVVVGAVDPPAVAPRSGLPLIVCRSSIGLFWAGMRDGRRHRSYDSCRSGTRCTAPEAAAGPSQLLRSSRGRIKQRAPSAGHESAARDSSGLRMGPAPSRSRLNGVHHWAVGGPGRIAVCRRSRRQTSGVALRVDAGHLLDQGLNRGGPDTRPVPYWSADKTINGPRQELAGGLGWV